MANPWLIVSGTTGQGRRFASSAKGDLGVRARVRMCVCVCFFLKLLLSLWNPILLNRKDGKFRFPGSLL